LKERFLWETVHSVKSISMCNRMAPKLKHMNFALRLMSLKLKVN